MTYDDVPAVERITATAFYELDIATQRADWPTPELRPVERAEPWMARMRHLVDHDGPGCWVAETDDGVIVGASAALVREGLWGLSTFAVQPGVQTQGVGKRLLDASLSYGRAGSPGMICSSHDSRAVRRYRLAGFDIHPAMFLWGRVRRSAIPAVRHARDGGESDLELLDEIDRSARGAGHGVDHGLLVTQMPLKLVEQGKHRGYAYLYPSGAPYLLAATDEGVARNTLWGALAESRSDEPAEFHNVTSVQAWAIDVGLSAGMELHGRGYLALRGMSPPTPYIPSGHFL